MSNLNVEILYDSGKLIDEALQTEDRDVLYRVIPKLYGYFKESENFVDEVKTFLASPIPALKKLKDNFSIAAQKMEGYAQPAFIHELQTRDEQQKIEFIRALGNVVTVPYCAEVEFERIPELFAEMAGGGITPESNVLILGAGSISISGLYFASFGAQVRLLDRDAAAYDNFLRIEPYLPKFVRDRILLEPVCDARDYRYPENLTHILIAGLVEPKNPVLEALKDFYVKNPALKRPVILMRVPKDNLFQLFYYAADNVALQDFEIKKVIDIGYEQSTLTYVLELKA